MFIITPQYKLKQTHVSGNKGYIHFLERTKGMLNEKHEVSSSFITFEEDKFMNERQKLGMRLHKVRLNSPHTYI